MLLRPGPSKHIGPRRRRTRGPWRPSPRRRLHVCRADRSKDQLTLTDITEETEVRRSWIEKRKKRSGEHVSLINFTTPLFV